MIFRFVVFIALAVVVGAADWPQFRGARRDGISDERGLLQSWTEGGPKLLWSTKSIGNGFSSPVIVSNRLFITGDVGSELHIFSFDTQGKRIWTATNGLAWNDQYPGARASVAFSGMVHHENAHGVVSTFNAATGQKMWSVDLLKTFKGENITWGLSECLLYDDKSVYATAGGRDGLVVALDSATGNVRWKSAPLESAGYVSPIVVRLDGRRYLIGCSARHLFCIDADNGKIIATRPFPTSYSVLSLTPALVGKDTVFMTAPHGKGGFLLRLPNLEEIWHNPLETCQGGVVYANGKLFGSYYQGRKGWAAIDAKSGKTIYQQPEFVKGSAIFADQRLYALSEDGWMRLIEPTETEFKVHGKFRFAEARGNDAWAQPVICDGRLYLRNHDILSCYDVRQGGIGSGGL